MYSDFKGKAIGVWESEGRGEERRAEEEEKTRGVFAPLLVRRDAKYAHALPCMRLACMRGQTLCRCVEAEAGPARGCGEREHGREAPAPPTPCFPTSSFSTS